MIKIKGLTKKTAEKRLVEYGPNEIRDNSGSTPLKILLRQIKSNTVVYLLAGAMGISFFVGKSVTAYTILAVILMVVIVGFVQEYRAEKAISALKGMLVPVSVVIRDGREHEIESSKIVQGDVLILRNGDRVPADCILIEGKELRVNESVLTGEAREVGKKTPEGKSRKDENLIFMGTYIVNGRCVAEVLHTGMNTKFGTIAAMISAVEKELPLQAKVDRIIRFIVWTALSTSLLTGLIMLTRSPVIDKEVIVSVLILIVALCVSAFPEGFPVVLITTLASGAKKMANQNAIVNRMSIIETLGETTVICSDKTGTITKGEMTVRKIFADNHFYEVTGSGYETKGHFMRDRKRVSPAEDPTLDLLIMDAVLCNDAIIKREKKNMEYKTIGSPTESALLFMGAKADRFREDMRWVRKEELPFSSERKRMSVLCEADGEKRVFAKGAPEYILEKCRFIQRQNRLMKLTERERKRILESNRVMTLASLRTMAFATKKVGALAKDHFEEGLVFLGLVGMEDPPREEVREAIRICHEAGIKVKMITGDNRETTLAIAKEIGLHGKIMEGGELDEITDGELKKAIGSIDLFARVKPEHKLRIVNALKANGEIVTMTGDGVNDAPALKEAHIGIAMGKNGTDVSRSVADLTLKDDNFKTIVSAIREGRTIFKNIRKFASYQLSCTFAELGILLFGVILSPVLGWQVPLLLALHILFMNLVTADLPAIGLGLNPSSSDTMLDPPRRNSEILGKKLIILILATGSTLMLLVLSSYYISFNLLGETHESARTVALFTLIGLEITGAFGFRSFRKGILGRGLLVNPYIFYASVISLILTLVIVYTPANRVFETVPLGLRSLGIVGGVSLLFVLASDALKYMNKKWKWVDMEHV